MNDLNSILLEGTLAKDPELSPDANGGSRCFLSIASDRYVRRGDRMEKEITGVHAYTEGKLAGQCMAQGHQGRKIRVVGRLKTLHGKDTGGRDAERVIIEAEHVEFRPEPAVKKEPAQSHESFER